ncbi:hypothetical protein LBMAG33_0570 [Candidatus Levyibacteriota bacterium]|nr:SufD family Fe-S cluster assembly protein [Candidatus Levybacteria bacterium]MSU25647.1 SufD family Fe-S cluster assembly protein [Candidatus Levybacteria bacterium]GDX61747.1 hypothetical protein LBMAG33_0570 [Candidatus Levybacteria bacterium]
MKIIERIIKDNQKCTLPFIWINGEEKEVNVKIRLVGKGASFHMVGLFLGTGSSKIVFNTDVTHEGENTKSMTTIRGVFKNNSSIDNDGMVRIQNGARGSDGFFSSKIILFDDAKGRSVPSLEIDENDLKAGHASTIGRPNEDQIFYMRSRGLTEKQAEELIISGFFMPFISYFPKSEQNILQKKIRKNL